MENTEQNNLEGELERLGEHKKSTTKAKKWPVVVLAVIAVLGIGFGVTMTILWLEEKNKAPEIVKETETEVVTETVVETEIQKVTTTAKDLKLSRDKFLTAEDGVAYRLEWNDSSVGVTVTLSEELAGEFCDGERLDEDGSNLELNLDWKRLNQVYNLGIPESRQVYETRTVEGIDARRVIDVMIGGFGQAVGDEVVFFVMDDGSVEYIPVYQAIKKNDFRSRGAISGVEGVIKMKQVSIISGCFGGMTILAQRANGEFYDLWKKLEAALDE